MLNGGLIEGQEVCGAPVQGLLTCLPSVQPPNPTPPTPDCCAAIKKGDENCLCAYKDSPQLPKYGIDKALFLALPTKCGLPPCPP
ncbi:putative lipid-transfer protein DIR1 [Bienertia sinuspersici]